VTLVLSPAPLGAELAGPAIRATELARAIGGEVVFSHPHAPGDLGERAAAAGVVVAHPAWPLSARALRRSGARLIYDLYDPEPLEALHFLAGRRAGVRRTVTAMSLDRLVNALHDGHAFLCASERQRDLWTGTLLAQRLIAPAVHDADPTLGGLLAVVPFGVPDEPPLPGAGPRERFGLDDEDEIVLWNGGLWDWLDAESVLHAVARLSPERPRLRLVFMGASPAAQARDAERRARALARDLGLLGRVVRFNDAWVPYEQRGAWLLQADCAVAAHHDHLETRFAHRTRLLDCLWAGLPVVCTRGDELAERVEREDLGATVPAEDPGALAGALARVLDRGRGAFTEQLAAAAGELRWSRVAEPLVGLAAAREGSEPLGARAGRRRPRSPALRGRDAVYVAARSVLNGVGRRDWPRVR
jgi:glycosyltransferase involved in cell wall biosynthesis